MQAAVAKHDQILRGAIESNAGAVFKTVGDAFYGSFVSAADAVAGALEVQRLITHCDWGEIGPIRVRVAWHTGVAELRDGDYFGQPLNRVSRVLSSGTGGQVLLTNATATLVRDCLPGGAGLTCLGSHRFRDLASPEQVFQLTHPDLPSDFPRLKSLEGHPNNLPTQVTSFVGRQKELARVKELLLTSRLLTLTGAAGSGKTRLAIQAAADLIDGQPDGGVNGHPPDERAHRGRRRRPGSW